MSPTPLLECQQIARHYSLGESRVTALDGVDLRLLPGDYLSITGPSGSGKSTLLNILGLLDQPDSGKVLIQGSQVELMTDDALSTLRNRTIGFVFQNFNLLGRSTALENVALPLVYMGLDRSQRKERAAQALERVGLGDRLSHRPSQLSGGQRQRVAIARALVTTPLVLLADEPTGNLDTGTGAEVLELFDSLRDPQRAIVVITHDEEVAARAARRIHLVDGRVKE